MTVWFCLFSFHSLSYYPRRGGYMYFQSGFIVCFSAEWRKKKLLACFFHETGEKLSEHKLLAVPLKQYETLRWPSCSPLSLQTLDSCDSFMRQPLFERCPLLLFIGFYFLVVSSVLLLLSFELVLTCTSMFCFQMWCYCEALCDFISVKGALRQKLYSLNYWLSKEQGNTC